VGGVDGIDVCEPFFIASVRGNMSMGLSVIFKKSPFAETYRITSVAKPTLIRVGMGKNVLLDEGSIAKIKSVIGQQNMD